MEHLISIIKIIALAQLVLIAGLIVVFFITRLGLSHREKKKKKVEQRIAHTIGGVIESQRLFTESELSFLKKDNFACLMYLMEINSLTSFPYLREQLSLNLFKPLARKYSTSKNWLKRYTAVLAYAYGFNNKDKANLFQLVNDPSLLVALNAAKIVMSMADSQAINTIIDVFSRGRRLQQSVCTHLLSETTLDIGPIIRNRLEHEENIYVRVFCYRLLSKLKQPQLISPIAEKDIKSNFIDLKIAALIHISDCTDPQKSVVINSLSQDSSWEVRATIAKLLGTYHTQSSLYNLEQLLLDGEWWVRLNAAHSLLNHGEEGLEILQKQDPHTNNEVFKLAQNTLQQLEKNS